MSRFINPLIVVYIDRESSCGINYIDLLEELFPLQHTPSTHQISPTLRLAPFETLLPSLLKLNVGDASFSLLPEWELRFKCGCTLLVCRSSGAKSVSGAATLLLCLDSEQVSELMLSSTGSVRMLTIRVGFLVSFRLDFLGCKSGAEADCSLLRSAKALRAVARASSLALSSIARRSKMFMCLLAIFNSALPSAMPCSKLIFALVATPSRI